MRGQAQGCLQEDLILPSAEHDHSRTQGSCPSLHIEEVVRSHEGLGSGPPDLESPDVLRCLQEPRLVHAADGQLLNSRNIRVGFEPAS